MPIPVIDATVPPPFDQLTPRERILVSLATAVRMQERQSPLPITDERYPRLLARCAIESNGVLPLDPALLERLIAEEGSS